MAALGAVPSAVIAVVPNFPAAQPVVIASVMLPMISLGPGALTSVQNGSSLDNGCMRSTHSMIVITSSEVTGGAIALQVSQDGTNYATVSTITLPAGAAITASTAVGAFRYARASITQTVSGTPGFVILATVASN